MPISCTVVRHGFLWLSEAKFWTFTRPSAWIRHGTEACFFGTRATPSMSEHKRP